MALKTDPTTTPIQWLDDNESRALFDEQARAMLGISGVDFLSRWDAGEYAGCADEPQASRIRRLAALIPFAR
ncbi:MAG TPA: hypothetical protein VFB73_15570 [Chloroflexota bacterium]|nr:hypothetical protein [Chloroflexota bacterium]HZU07382.1 hypothetical protein [Chloroflexota bacterium]